MIPLTLIALFAYTLGRATEYYKHKAKEQNKTWY